MSINKLLAATLLTTPILALPHLAQADENLFGYVKGAEVLPAGAWEFDQELTYRGDKGVGSYHAWDSKSEIEYGVTDKFSASPYFRMQSINTKDIVVDAYIAGDEHYGMKPSGVGTEFKYMFLSPAKDDIGLAGYLDVGYSWLDKHSGLDKNSLTLELQLIAQKYFMEGQMVLVGNIGIESTYAHRADLTDARRATLPADFDWPAHNEMEVELKAGTGLSYRFAPNWSAGAEALYEIEYETVVGPERWSVFAGPNIHYGGEKFWATLTWFPQIAGYGRPKDAQLDDNLQLIEKTKQEIRFKFGIDF
ncbi:MAG: DUF6662 family protein [Methylophilaceae bacterium]